MCAREAKEKNDFFKLLFSSLGRCTVQHDTSRPRLRDETGIEFRISFRKDKRAWKYLSKRVIIQLLVRCDTLYERVF